MSCTYTYLPPRLLGRSRADRISSYPTAKCFLGTIGEYVNLTESETAKLLYKRINRDITAKYRRSIEECTEYAQEIRNGVLSESSLQKVSQEELK